MYTLVAERKETGNEQGWAFFFVELENVKVFADYCSKDGEMDCS